MNSVKTNNSMQTQHIESRYIRMNRLMQLLTQLFGKGNFVVDVIDGSYRLSVPRRLTDEEIDGISF
ncbi:hypothetical protein L873DRAFT_1797464 [Choiromyces venosus 120613-1]|uniref:Uncharacterized protein n=1 Tax=Choiromyces venosus 120613-1 TaxID=1336337 RepID=A0A3N4KIR3_9PEZI|nr:hypothetical protein L873DRAFT_1797464 [Choiromyces venosus 120613-1]